MSTFEEAWPEIHKQGIDHGWRGIAKAAWDAALATAPAQPVAMPDGENIEEFKQWLNENRMADVSSVFHEIVCKVCRMLAAPVAQGDAKDMEYWLDARQAHCLGQHRRVGDIIDAAIAAKAAS